MKKVFSRGLSLFVILTLALIMCVSTAAAAPTPYASDFLNQYDGVVSSEGDGTIKISFSVVGTGIISKIGVSKIVLEKQDGQYWIPVKTYNNTKNPELSTTNDYSYANYVLYDGEAGANYRAEITFFGNTDYRTIVTSPERA